MFTLLGAGIERALRGDDPPQRITVVILWSRQGGFYHREPMILPLGHGGERSFLLERRIKCVQHELLTRVSSVDTQMSGLTKKSTPHKVIDLRIQFFRWILPVLKKTSSHQRPSTPSCSSKREELSSRSSHLQPLQPLRCSWPRRAGQVAYRLTPLTDAPPPSSSCRHPATKK